jgi:hypothetical protein
MSALPDAKAMSAAEWREEYSLREYVGKRQNGAVSANSCDYRGTGRSELDAIEDRARRLRAAYLEWRASADPEVVAGCAEMWRIRHGSYGAHELAEVTVGADYSRHSPGGRTLLAPAYLRFYDDCEGLKAAMRPSRAADAFPSGERP